MVIEKMDSLGKICIPEEIREELAISEKTSLKLYCYDNRIIIERLNSREEDDDCDEVPEVPTIEEFRGEMQDVAEEIQTHLRSIEDLIESISFL